ncbi:hypothetical protein [Aquihabitans sp. McL0605]|uniref:hypothetical protein n=1 Tax=Aquihabitans sp. McL0605 TaxID=3415671 RepID=UPI003CF88FF9
MTTLIRLVNAFYLQQLSGVDDRLYQRQQLRLRAIGAGVGLPADQTLADDLRAATDRIHALQPVVLGSWLVLVGLLVVWGLKRRPKALLLSHGETHVETQARRIEPTGWYRVQWGVAAAAILLGLLNSTSPDLSQVASHRSQSALANLAWAVVFALSIPIVLCSERLLARRTLLAQQLVAAAVPVAYVAPIDPPRGDPELAAARPGWILVTAGKVTLIGIGGLCAVAFIGQALDPTISARPQFAVAGIVLGALVLWVIARRWLPDRWALRRTRPAGEPASF